MARVFISVLGTGDYQECAYCINQEPVCNSVRFVQEALIGHFCNDWSDNDRIIIFTTDESYEKNWKDDGHVHFETREKLKREGLESRLKKLNLKPTPVTERIPKGNNEDEIWSIFQIILENIHDQDEITFDITHAFRSLPMLVMTVLNYAKVVKKVTLARICYGNYEARDPSTNHAPIIDLSVFDQLLAWTFAIDGFLVAGDASRLKTLADKTLAPVLELTRGKDKGAQSLQYIAKGLDDFSRDISTCRGPKISKNVRLLKKHISNYRKSNHLKAMDPLIQLIGAKLEPFTDDVLIDGLAATRWCIEHNLIQQGFTILQEAVISFLILRMNGKPLNVTDRKIVSQTLSHHRCQRPSHEWSHESGANLELSRAYYDMIDSFPGLSGVFNELAEQRNNLNHAAWRPETPNKPKFDERLKDIATGLETILVS